jgi:hypothetical protein
VAQVGEGRDLGHRTDVDDRAAASLEHPGDDGRSQRQGAPEIGLQNLAGFVPIAGYPSQPLHAGAGVVDHHVDPAQRFVRALREAGRLLALAQIGGDDAGSGSA